MIEWVIFIAAAVLPPVVALNVGTMIAGGYGALPGTLTASNIVGAFGGDSLGALIATNPQWTAAAASAAEGAVAASAAAEGAAAAAVAAEGAAATCCIHEMGGDHD